jgi:hypothetical protein
MAHLSIELQEEYRRIFGGKKYNIPALSTAKDVVPGYNIDGIRRDEQYTPKGGLLSEILNGVEIWLPVKFYAPEFTNGVLSLPYSVVQVSMKNIFVKTPMNQRRGAVKEHWSAEDYNISIKGFLIGENRQFPEEEIEKLKMLHLSKRAIELSNAITDILLINEGVEKDKVVIEDIDLPIVEGGRKHVRPFTMKLESDCIFTLEVEE